MLGQRPRNTGRQLLFWKGSNGSAEQQGIKQFKLGIASFGEAPFVQRLPKVEQPLLKGIHCCESIRIHGMSSTFGIFHYVTVTMIRWLAEGLRHWFSTALRARSLQFLAPWPQQWHRPDGVLQLRRRDQPGWS